VSLYKLISLTSCGKDFEEKKNVWEEKKCDHKNKIRNFWFLRKERIIFDFRFSVITSLPFYFRWVCLAGEDSVSEEEEVDDDDEGKVGRIGRPKRSEIGRRCCWFSFVSGRAWSSLGCRGGVAGSTSIWVSLLEWGLWIGESESIYTREGSGVLALTVCRKKWLHFVCGTESVQSPWVVSFSLCRVWISLRCL